MRALIFSGYVAFVLSAIALFVFLAGEFFGRIGYMTAGALVAAFVVGTVKEFYYPSPEKPRR